MLDAELSVSTRPAALTAATRVDSTGLAEAAVATGAVAIPLKLPAPDFGTDEQPGPKSIGGGRRRPDPPRRSRGEADAAGADDSSRRPRTGTEPLELHAAAVRARPAASPETARRRYFTVSP